MLEVVEQFNAAFALKEAGDLEAAERVWLQADALLSSAPFMTSETTAFAWMVRNNVWGTIQRQRQQLAAGDLAFDKALRVAADYLQQTRSVALFPPHFAPPTQLVPRPPDDHLLVTVMLARVYYNKAQINRDFGLRSVWTRYMVYALDVYLKIVAATDRTDIIDEVQTMLETIPLTELPFFWTSFIAYQAQQIQQAVPLLAKVAESAIFQQAVQLLQLTRSPVLISSTTWNEILTLVLAILESEPADWWPLVEESITTDVAAVGDFSVKLFEEMRDKSFAYLMGRLCLATTVAAEFTSSSMAQLTLALAKHSFDSGMEQESIELLEAMEAHGLAHLTPELTAVRATLLANAYSNIGQSKEATTLYQDVLAQLESAQRVREGAIVIANIVDDANLSGDYEKSFRLAQRSLDQLPADEVSDGRGLLLLNLGVAATALGKQQIARSSLEEAVTIARLLHTTQPYGHKALYNLGLMKSESQFTEAVKLLTQAVAWSRQRNHYHDQAHYLYELGRLHDQKGQIDTAVQLLRSGLEVARRTDDTRIRLLITASLAGIYMEQFDQANAVTYFRSALRLARSQDDWGAEIWILGNLGILFSRQKHYAAATQMWQEQIALAEKHGRQRFHLEALNHQAIMAFSQADMAGTMFFADKALMLAEEIGDRRAMALAYMIMGNVIFASEQYADAIVFHQTALELLQDVDDLRLQLKINGFLGMAYGRYGDRQAAVRHLNFAVEQAVALGQFTSAASFTFQLAGLAEQYFGNKTFALTQYQKTLKYLEAVRTDRELLAAFEGPVGTLLNPYEAYQKAAHLAWQLGFPADAFAVVERGRSRQLLQLLRLGFAYPFTPGFNVKSDWVQAYLTRQQEDTSEMDIENILQAELRRMAQQEFQTSGADGISLSGVNQEEGQTNFVTPATVEEVRRLLASHAS